MGYKMQMVRKVQPYRAQLKRIKQYCKEGVIKEGDIVGCAEKFLLFEGMVNGKPVLTEVGRDAIKDKPKPLWRGDFDMEAALERVKQ